MPDKIKCPRCGVSVPDVPEDACYREKLCSICYEDRYELIREIVRMEHNLSEGRD